MTTTLLLIAVFTVVAAAIGLACRNLIHAALFLVLAWGGVAVFYLWAGAEFLAFAQALIYAGAISMVVLFAVLLTRRTAVPEAEADAAASGRIAAGLLVGGLVAGVLGYAVATMPASGTEITAPHLTVRALGRQLMETHAAALLVVGVILTVALIGAVVIAATAARDGPEELP